MMDEDWRSVESAPLAEYVFLWNPVWRHPYPGMVTGECGRCWIDAANPNGIDAHATHWMAIKTPPGMTKAVPDPKHPGAMKVVELRPIA